MTLPELLKGRVRRFHVHSQRAVRTHAQQRRRLPDAHDDLEVADRLNVL